jgi:hypothetical protein
MKKVCQNQSFKIKGQNIEIIDSYCYLGMLLNHNGNFCTAHKKITEQAFSKPHTSEAYNRIGLTNESNSFN